MHIVLPSHTVQCTGNIGKVRRNSVLRICHPCRVFKFVVNCSISYYQTRILGSPPLIELLVINIEERQPFLRKEQVLGRTVAAVQRSLLGLYLSPLGSNLVIVTGSSLDKVVKFPLKRIQFQTCRCVCFCNVPACKRGSKICIDVGRLDFLRAVIVFDHRSPFLNVSPDGSLVQFLGSLATYSQFAFEDSFRLDEENLGIVHHLHRLVRPAHCLVVLICKSAFLCLLTFIRRCTPDGSLPLVGLVVLSPDREPRVLVNCKELVIGAYKH